MWRIATLTFRNPEDLANHILSITGYLEAEVPCVSVYFARHIDDQGSIARISFEVEDHSEDNLSRLQERFPVIQSIELSDRNEGSHVHSLGYQMAKHLSLVERPNKGDELQDVLHWLHNMIGYTYVQEIRRYIDYAKNLTERLRQLYGGVLFLPGDGETTQIGFLNRNRQMCYGTLRVQANDHLQYAYRLECLNCGYTYGANGADISERKCSECQGGEPGIRYWKKI